MPKKKNNIQYHDDIAIADTAFTVRGKTPDELFQNAGKALFKSMSDIAKIDPKISRNFELQSEQLDLLLFDFLDELLFYKDSERLLFSEFDVKVNEDSGEWKLSALIKGEKADPDRHKVTIDVKAITMHMFEVKKTKSGYEARVVIDI